MTHSRKSNQTISELERQNKLLRKELRKLDKNNSLLVLSEKPSNSEATELIKLKESIETSKSDLRKIIRKGSGLKSPRERSPGQTLKSPRERSSGGASLKSQQSPRDRTSGTTSLKSSSTTTTSDSKSPRSKSPRNPMMILVHDDKNATVEADKNKSSSSASSASSSASDGGKSPRANSSIMLRRKNEMVEGTKELGRRSSMNLVNDVVSASLKGQNEKEQQTMTDGSKLIGGKTPGGSVKKGAKLRKSGSVLNLKSHQKLKAGDEEVIPKETEKYFPDYNGKKKKEEKDPEEKKKSKGKGGSHILT